MKEYNDKYKGYEINEDNIEFYTDLDYFDWIEFTGLFSDDITIAIINPEEIILVGEYPNFVLKAENENIALKMNFFLKRKVIYNETFVLSEELQGRGIGLIAMQTQIRRATNAGFKQLECWAYRDETTYFCGYLVWAKLGFTMKSTSHQEFLEYIALNERKETCLQRLLYTKQGYDFWNDKGVAWMGIFNLSPNSLNRRLLKKYKKYSKTKKV